MPTPFGSYPFNAAGVDPYTNPQVIPSNRAPTSQDIYPQGWFIVDNSVNPPVIYQTVGNGVWESGGNAHATTSSYGTVLLNDSVTMAGASDDNVPTSLAIKTYADNLAIAGAPAWSETVSGIGQLSTLAEAAAAVDDNTAMTPLKVAAALAAGLPVTGGAGSFTTLAASGLASLSGSATITTGATALNLASDASTGAVNIGTGAGARVITIGNVTGATSVNVNTGTGSFNVATTGSGDVILNAADTVLIDSAGVLELNSSAGVIGIGNDAVAQAINIGTGAAARTITLGNASGATSLVLNAGTGAINIGTNAIAHTVSIGNQTGASAVVIDSGTGPITIGTTIAKTITIGNVTGASAVVVNSGTGGIALASTGAGDIIANSADTLLLDSAGVLELNSSAGIISIGNDAVSQNINVGTAGTRAIAVGNSTATTSIALDTGTGSSLNLGTNAIAHTVTIGNVTGATAVTVNTGTGGFNVNTTGTGDVVVASADTVLIDSAGVLELNSSAGVISIGNDAVAQNINVGTGAAARVITLGNSSGATSVVVDSGTGAINIGTNAIAHTVTLGNVTGATAVNINAGSGGSIITTTNSALQLVSGTGAVSISADAAATTVNIGTGAAVVKTINIGGTGANVVSIANTQTGGSLAIGAAMTTGTISIGGTGLQTGTITLGGGTGAQTVNVATGGTGIKTVHIADSLVANVVTLGSTTGAAATTIQAGTGLITMAGKIALNSSAGPQFLAGAGSPSGIVTAPQASLWLRTDGSSTTTRAYINTDSGTTWTAVTTVA